MSLYIFSKVSPFRIGCYRLMKHSDWETIIIGLIVLSSLKLATDTYLQFLPKESIILPIQGWLDHFFSYAFIFEATVKIIAMGFGMDEGSYIRDSWNQLDFIIVITSVVDMSV